jgi:hypothetical protein
MMRAHGSYQSCIPSFADLECTSVKLLADYVVFSYLVVELVSNQ